MPIHQQGSTSVLEIAPGGICPDLQEAHWKHPGARPVGRRWVHVWKGHGWWWLWCVFWQTSQIYILEKIIWSSCRMWFVGAYILQVLSAVAGFKVQNSGYQSGVQAKQGMDQVPSLHPSPASCRHLTFFAVCMFPIRRLEARPVSAKRPGLLGGGPDQGSPVDVCLH